MWRSVTDYFQSPTSSNDMDKMSLSAQLIQSAENPGKECHRFWLRFHSDFECSKISFNENKSDGIDLNSWIGLMRSNNRRKNSGRH